MVKPTGLDKVDWRQIRLSFLGELSKICQYVESQSILVQLIDNIEQKKDHEKMIASDTLGHN